MLNPDIGEIILVEEIQSDTSRSIVIGRLVAIDEDSIKLVDAAWVADTGRRHLFFAGTPGEHYEVEPYPDGMEITLSRNATIYSWPHPVPRVAVP